MNPSRAWMPPQGALSTTGEPWIICAVLALERFLLILICVLDTSLPQATRTSGAGRLLRHTRATQKGECAANALSRPAPRLLLSATECVHCSAGRRLSIRVVVYCLSLRVVFACATLHERMLCLSSVRVCCLSLHHFDHPEAATG